ncbi:TIGR02302 family protein [Rhizobium tubonense]|uniref:TIGR02302 family protein n=1 Tax=Rhizobium tubonense TaxID=484088 RepID=A0A2W4C7L5_9HYPH|nr:TIGR02302 family protein [Rhizobium tubonense]PZM09482.1 TIGR02302 family protein [Rhizobium tubonense]
MTNASNDKKGAFASRPTLARLVAVKRVLARLVLVSEQLLPMLLPVLSVIALYLCASWFGLFRILPELPRVTLLAVFVAAFAASIAQFRRLRWPDVSEADRLLEERNGLSHQPVTVQEDEPAFDTSFARALWREHQIRMAERIAVLDTGLPRPDIANHDRFALRAIPALLLVAAFSFSMSNNGGSIVDAFQNVPGTNTNPDLRVDAWVTPPYYTGQAPTYLTGNTATAADVINVPQFSDLTVRITGGEGGEKVVFQSIGSERGTEVALQEDKAAATSNQNGTTAGAAPANTDIQTKNAESNATAGAVEGAAAPTPVAHTYALKLEKGGALVVNGRQWTFNVLSDKPPEIAFDGIPHATVNGALEIGFKAKDDYGIEEAHAEIVPVEIDPQAKPLYPLPDYKFEIGRRNRRDVKGLGSHDLSQDPLAGKRVRVTLVARDGAGQTGRSPPHEMTLPSRNFSEPLAGAVAEERQVFSLDTRKMPEAIDLNQSLTIRADETIPNLTHYLLLQSALTRMRLANNDAALKDTADYLWQIATGMEDGQLSDAEKKLRDAQKKLSDALQRNASDNEIKQLTDELRKAMNDYMKELAERMQNAPMQPNQKSANVLRQQDLERMMDQIENLARSGNRDAAQQMLSELQRMMNNLQAGKPQQGQQQGQENSEARKQMDKLGQILRDQQKLMEQTFRLDQAMKDRMQRGDPNEDGDPLDQPMPGPDGQPQQSPQGQQQQGQQQDGQQQPGQQQGQSSEDGKTVDELREALKQLRKQQDELGKQLGELQKGLNGLGVKPGPGFGQAQREMQGAAGELGQGHGEPAVQGQSRALEQLRQGARDMLTQMMQAQQQQGVGQQGGKGQGQGQGNQGGRDPLGRALRNDGGLGDNGGPKIPDEIDVQRAREILDAIRQRLGNNPTMEEERRYLERLLDIQ